MPRLTRIIVGQLAGDLRRNTIVGYFEMPPTVGHSFNYYSTGLDDPDCGRVITTSKVIAVTPQKGGCVFDTKSGSIYLLETDYDDPASTNTPNGSDDPS